MFSMEDLVKKAKNGDKYALLKLIMDKKAEFYRLAYLYTSSREDAMDAISEMTVILYNKICKLKDEGKFYSYAKTILVNACRDILRKRKNIILTDYQDYQGTYDEEGKETLMDVFEILKTLSQDQQEVIKLKYLLDMDYQTIAEICKVPVGTVKSRIFNGIRKIKEALGGEY